MGGGEGVGTRIVIEKLRRFVSHNRIVTSAAFGVLFLILAHPTPNSLLLGLPVVVLGEAVRTWASGYIRKDNRLATDGLYSLTRNPLYLGNFLLGFGFSIMANRWPVILAFLAVFLLIYDATIEEEERKLLKRFGDAFVDYCREVPRFFPRFTGWRAAPFEWALVRQHREFKTWGAVAGIVAVILMKMWWEDLG